MEIIKKIWKDPVWSKVISTGILAIITIIYLKIKSLTDKISFEKAFEELFQLKVSLGSIVVIIFIFMTMRFAYLNNKKRKNSNTGIYSQKHEQLRKMNSLRDNEKGLLFKWDVYFTLNNIPFISELTTFCTLHGEVPIRFIDNRCQDYSCKNSQWKIDKHVVINHIESELIHKWDKLNSL